MPYHFSQLEKQQLYAALNNKQLTNKIIELLSNNEAEDHAGEIQGHYGLLTNFYFTGGLATNTVIAVEDTDTWLDVNLDVHTGTGLATLSGETVSSNALGMFDYRPEPMKLANAIGHSGAGTQADPIIMLLEGMDLTSSANFRAAMTFTPDEDGGRLDSRLCFTRHSGAIPAGEFSIEASSVAMESGADIEYANTPNIQFFVGDTIDTNGVGDAGKVRFQIRSDVAGTLSMREMALFIQL